MGDFKNRGSFGGDRGGFGKKREFGGGFGGNSGGGGFGRSRFGRPGNHEFRQAQMHSAICAECGKSCEVPFRPNGEKPVYCNNCFAKNKPQGERSFSSNSSSAPASRPSFDAGQNNEMKKQLDIVISKLDKVMEILSGGAKVSVSKEVVKEAPVKSEEASKKSETKVAKKKVSAKKK